ncbi:DNA primase [invertebrate metagenome]|uniref:DNA primase n=1 Tax=invertebrate metagenome TaxID=1711999 RepID=A0A484HCR0_9ZZZZ
MPSSSCLDALRARLPLATVIGQKVRLTRRGREYIGLCPFHNEKTPSFTVNEAKGFFHCFGCGAHGDLIGFVMQAEGLSFLDAVQRLSQAVGLKVTKHNPNRNQQLLDVMEMATAFYEQQLRLSTGRIGLDYLHGRGLDDELILSFRLGFAPSGNACGAALRRAGINEKLLTEVGLVRQSERDLPSYDTFRERIIFPITDTQGRVIAFGGRALGAAHPKYLNSSATPLFRKGAVLYGLAQARSSALAKGVVVVTEGYMDVLSLAEAGFPYAVAPLGTTLTEEQMIILWRLAPEPILCFDGDTAGRRAATHAADRVLRFLKPGLSVRFALLPEGKDPDELVRTEGASALATILSRALPLYERVWQTLLEGRPLETPEQLAALEQGINTLTSRIADRTIRQHYRSLLHKRRRALLRAPGWSSKQARRQVFCHQWSDACRSVSTAPRMQDIADCVLAAFLLAYPQVLVRHVEQATEFLAGNRALANMLEVAATVLAERSDMDGRSLVSILERDYGTATAIGTLRRYLTAALQRQCSDPEADYQRMLLALHEQALTHDIEDLQTLLATDPSPEVWQRLQRLQQERSQLHKNKELLLP